MKKFKTKRNGLLGFALMAETVLSKMPSGGSLRKKAHNHKGGTSPSVFTAALSKTAFSFNACNSASCAAAPRFFLEKLCAPAPLTTMTSAAGISDGCECKYATILAMFKLLLYKMRDSIEPSLGSLPARTCNRTRMAAVVRADLAPSGPADDEAVGEGGAGDSAIARSPEH